MSTESEIVAMFTREENPLTVAQIAAREGVSKPTIYLILHRHDVPLRPHVRAPAEPKVPKVRQPRQLRDKAPGARFVAYKTEPERSVGLSPQHPACVEGRTLFPGNVVGAMASPRLLVSGENNPKTGKKVLKGPWRGMPIFTLTLEERRTCPRDCAVWESCYGNAMQWPRRNDAFDPDFMGALAAEVVTTCRANPGGIVVRLHVLGDFFSVRYVAMWAHLLAMLPGLHLWGYTARRAGSDDAGTRKIAAAVAQLNRAPSRCVIRTSDIAPGRMRTIVVDEDPRQPGVIVCPAQVEMTHSCATCALCWAKPAASKTVAFLRHGIKSNTRSPT